MSDPTLIVLNSNQRRHFEVLFARLEDSLAKIEALLEPEPAGNRILSLLDDDVSDDFRAPAEAMLQRVRGRLAELATTLKLTPRRLSRRRAIAATLTSEAIRLEDSLSPQLRGYGRLDPTVAQHLDPILSEMAATLAALANRARGTR